MDEYLANERYQCEPEEFTRTQNLLKVVAQYLVNSFLSRHQTRIFPS